jgi:acid phosphatase
MYCLFTSMFVFSFLTDRAAETYADNLRNDYRPKIAKRLNKYLHGLTLDPYNDIEPMMDLCVRTSFSSNHPPYSDAMQGFQTEIAGSSPFCDIFTQSEWEEFEYAMDLQYYYGSGPGNPLAGTTFWPYLKGAPLAASRPAPPTDAAQR